MVNFELDYQLVQYQMALNQDCLTPSCRSLHCFGANTYHFQLQMCWPLRPIGWGKFQIF